MNPRRAWNPDLEETYLLEYSEYKDEIFTNGTLGFYLWLVIVSTLETSSIPRYSECTKTTHFIFLGFSSPGQNRV